MRNSTHQSDALRVVSIREQLALALADDHPLQRLDRFLEALAQLRGDREAAIAQCSLWRLPESGSSEMQRIRGRYLIHGSGFDDQLLQHMFTTNVGELAESGLLVLRRRLAESPRQEMIGDYASIVGREVWQKLDIYRNVLAPLGCYNALTHYWRIDAQRCLNTSIWLPNSSDQPDEAVRALGEPLFLLAKPLIEKVFLHDVIGQAIKALTERQSEVLHLLLAGFSEKQIAGKLHRSAHTIHSHVRELYRQFEVQSRAELMALFVDEAALPTTGSAAGTRGQEMVDG